MVRVWPDMLYNANAAARSWALRRWRQFQGAEEFEAALGRFLAVTNAHLALSNTAVAVYFLATAQWLAPAWRAGLAVAGAVPAAALAAGLAHHHRTGDVRVLATTTIAAVVLVPGVARLSMAGFRPAYYVSLFAIIYPLLVDLPDSVRGGARAAVVGVLLSFAIAEGLDLGGGAFVPQRGPVPRGPWLFACLIGSFVSPASVVGLLVGLQRVLGHRRALQAALRLQRQRERELDAERRVVERLLESALPRDAVRQYLAHLREHASALADAEAELELVPGYPHVDAAAQEDPVWGEGWPGDATPMPHQVSAGRAAAAAVVRVAANAGPSGPRRSALLLAAVHQGATVLFADIAGFTRKSSLCTAEALVESLSVLVTAADEACLALGVEKIRTIGDCYQAAAFPGRDPPRSSARNGGGGLADARAGAAAVLRFATVLHGRIAPTVRLGGEPVQLRAGAHTGPVVAGVLGLTKFCYDLWGETVTVASRLESTGVAGRTQVSRETSRLLCDDHAFLYNGRHPLKGGGSVEGFLHVLNPVSSATANELFS